MTKTNPWLEPWRPSPPRPISDEVIREALERMVEVERREEIRRVEAERDRRLQAHLRRIPPPEMVIRDRDLPDRVWINGVEIRRSEVDGETCARVLRALGLE